MKKSLTGRNALEWSVGAETWVMTTDNSGAIGEKEEDEIIVPYSVVSYYSFRVAVLDCLSAGALPRTVILHNFCGEQAWGKLVEGIHQGIGELGLQNVTITGSTESNMMLKQSAVAITVLGERTRLFTIEKPASLKWTLIGEPLVGEDVISKADCAAPLSKALDIFKNKNTAALWPVGSKGVQKEWEQLASQYRLAAADMPSFEADLTVSAGPSTCWIVGEQLRM
ncbi:hypothetical protein [Jeotgalibacillus soli]|uniref:ATP-binding domain of ThiL/HypE-like (N-terminal domain) family protein n=1 Tax=Jeotgalibacillus soli TaxID=889306 RepID=A0A0C2W0L3_9BACL|nr:hypothetical protein [Jeotgalibacillus soli]KIL49723.1 hypothetical protein KP78_11910 [Jeotgalibacillus soli]